MEQIIKELRQKLEKAVNEICLNCGKYTLEHEGACDGCIWLKERYNDGENEC